MLKGKMRRYKKPKNFLSKCKITDEFRDMRFEFGDIKQLKIYEDL